MSKRRPIVEDITADARARQAARAGASPLLFHGGRFYTEHPL